MTKNIYGGVTSYKLNKLQPFWSYSISIRAKTVKGFGPESAKIIVDTLESSKSNTTYIYHSFLYLWKLCKNLLQKSQDDLLFTQGSKSYTF